jgi:hypothetical protein
MMAMTTKSSTSVKAVDLLWTFMSSTPGLRGARRHSGNTARRVALPQVRAFFLGTTRSATLRAKLLPMAVISGVFGFQTLASHEE